jgi:cell division protein FtsQ
VSDKKSLSRADLLRQRRKNEGPRRLTKPADRVRRNAPVVTGRNVTLDAATVRVKPKAKPLRQYQSIAAAPTAQLHAPALPHIRIGWRLLSFFLVALFGAAIYFAWTMPMFRVTGTTLAGNQILSAQEVSAALRLNGVPVFLLVPADMETALRLTFPEITSVKVSVNLPNKVAVTIKERQPVIRWEQNGVFTWVDAEGVAVRPRGEMDGLVAVHASGAPPTGPKSESDALAPIPFAAPSIIETVRVLAPYVPQGSVLLYDPKYGVGWIDGRGWTVWFGSSASQMDVKLRVYTVLVDSLAQRGISPTFINVAYPNAPYYRLGQ